MNDELTSLAIAGLNCSDDDLKAIASALITLVRYHDRQATEVNESPTVACGVVALLETIDALETCQMYPKQKPQSVRESHVVGAASESTLGLVKAYDVGFKCPDCGTQGEGIIFRTDTAIAKVVAMFTNVNIHKMVEPHRWFIIETSHASQPQLLGPFATPLQALDTLPIVDNELAQSLRSRITLDQLEANPKVKA